MAEELETVLRLVAEGRLSPEEAAPIIEALTRAERADPDSDDEHDFGAGFGHGFERGFARLGRLDRLGRRIDRKVARRDIVQHEILEHAHVVP